MKKYNVAVIGVGAVGIEMLRVLRQRNSIKNHSRSSPQIHNVFLDPEEKICR